MRSPEPLASLEARPLSIPFRVSFKHASAERAAMQSLWVTARSRDGMRGDGEGCPREYVTSESLEGALEFFGSLRDEWMRCLRDVGCLAAWARENRAQVDRHPAAWCAVELAMLDLFGRRDGVPIESLLGRSTAGGPFRYTAVLGDSSSSAFDKQLGGYLAAGFREFKIKLSGDASRDHEKVRALRAAAIAPGAVRADANNLWRTAEQAATHLRALDYPFFAIEEPLAAGDIAGLRELIASLGMPVILDESVTRLEHLDRLRQDPDGWIVNVRVSKMGGVTRAIELADAAQAMGIGVIVGAHVGETSLLTRAALAVGRGAGGPVLAREGAFGTHLLDRDIVLEPLMFGPGGLLQTERVAASPGLGLDIA